MRRLLFKLVSTELPRVVSGPTEVRNVLPCERLSREIRLVWSVRIMSYPGSCHDSHQLHSALGRHGRSFVGTVLGVVTPDKVSPRFELIKGLWVTHLVELVEVSVCWDIREPSSGRLVN